MERQNGVVHAANSMSELNVRVICFVLQLWFSSLCIFSLSWQIEKLSFIADVPAISNGLAYCHFVWHQQKCQSTLDAKYSNNDSVRWNECWRYECRKHCSSLLFSYGNVPFRQQYIMKSRQFRNSRDKRGFYNNFDGKLFGYNIVSFNVSENVNFVNNQSAYNCRLYNEIWFEKIKAFFLCVCLCTKHHLSNLDIENNNFAVLLSLQNISRSSSNVFFFLLDSITSINSAHCIRLCSLMDCSLHWLNMGFVSVCMSVSVFFSRTVSDSLSFFRPTTLHIFPCQCVSNVISHSIAHTT